MQKNRRHRPQDGHYFATAHEGYMPEAFEVYAFDYLVKPFRMQRLEQTLDRIKVTGRFRQGTSGSKQDTSTGKRTHP